GGLPGVPVQFRQTPAHPQPLCRGQQRRVTAQARPTHWRKTLDGAERRYWARYDGLASLAYAAPADKPLNGRGALELSLIHI
ncbi:hypothetical protein, partial [Pseudomonas aeruginosa]|uniref:hypothetical protein n=1 Tax=Pseudomonas aeruginosa TaxID=287 RepID=UPI0024BBEFA0